MEPIYVFGHKNPDSDSIAAALAYAALNNTLGESEYVAARLGHMNDETTYLLKRFGIEPPVFLGTAATQISDIDIDHPARLGRTVPVSHAWHLLQENEHLNALPVVNEDGTLYGMITAGSIAESDMMSIQTPYVQPVPVYNVLSALEGRIINTDEDVFDTISGDVIIALPGLASRTIHQGSVVLCGQQEDVVADALEKKAACVILCQSDLAEKYHGISSETCVIATPCDAYRAARMLYQSIPVERIAQSDNLVFFHTDDYLDDVRETVLKSRYRSYPVLDRDNKVVGTLGRFHLLRPKHKRVVLVDHNERSQSVSGLDQAEILAIIDHHRLGDVTTGYPVFMRNEPVGSSTTIVATMFQERGLMPSEKLAGLMASAIISDTVAFKSPTCTARDRRMAERLAHIAGVDLDALSMEIFAATSAADKRPEEMLQADFKEFHLNGHSIGISQVTCTDTEKIISRLDEILPEMEKLRAASGYDMVLLLLTNVLRFGSELVFVGDADTICQAFGLTQVKGQHIFLPNVVSRKKQIVPALSAILG